MAPRQLLRKSRSTARLNTAIARKSDRSLTHAIVARGPPAVTPNGGRRDPAAVGREEGPRWADLPPATLWARHRSPTTRSHNLAQRVAGGRFARRGPAGRACPGGALPVDWWRRAAGRRRLEPNEPHPRIGGRHPGPPGLRHTRAGRDHPPGG